MAYVLTPLFSLFGFHLTENRYEPGERRLVDPPFPDMLAPHYLHLCLGRLPNIAARTMMRQGSCTINENGVISCGQAR